MTRTSSRRPHEAGFTLTEMMMVVAIIALLSATVAYYANPKPKSGDAAQMIADAMRETARRAVMRGSVPTSVQGITDPTSGATGAIGKMRARMRILSPNNAKKQIIIEEVFDNGDVIPVWKETFPSDSVTIAGWRTASLLTDMTSNGTLPTGAISGSDVVVECFPDGRCCGRTAINANRDLNCSGVTVFLKNANIKSIQPFARTVMMPLAGSTKVTNHW